ncbi:MAG: hypothetical protein A2070_01830 [Bdellovibrionales bacterium GWC1_52_8]|nr:MAG: hypothetical protein A2Z97_10745 [Bdellovibrionales bacterium GWB1_52_6]OFZ03371.1 MAG: hypothetical protein A2X97_05350 [Bdellovibrionales bacterium GWA1_52_35]OFZ43071.1 MAG: hypothetical protein A2070_01830 [Bdellovibrionales bacterium GWC1_52_8]
MGHQLGSLLLRSTLFAFVLCWALASAHGAELLPSVISFGGTGVARILVDETERVISVGQKIEYGSKIKTGPENTVTIQYPDQTIVSIDADSEVEIQERTGGTQASRLHVGQIRASVLKLKTGQILPSKPRFLVRTRAAVLGVRGTEFVMAVDQTGYTTQVHTLEGIVDVAADENKLLSGQGVQVETGKFVQATEQGVNAPQIFEREEFINSLKPSVPGGPAAPVFTDVGGHTISKSDLIKLSDPRVNPEPPAFKKEELAQQKPPEQNQPKPEEAKSKEEGRRAHLWSFQAAVFYTTGFSDPEFRVLRRPNPKPLENPYWHSGFADRIRAASFSWNPTVPLPLTGFLSLRGHLGWLFARDGSLLNRLLVREMQGFVNATLFKKFFAEMGLGKQTWLHSPFSEGLFTVNAGLALRSNPKGLEIDRIFIGRSLLLTRPRVEEFKAGLGFSF